MAKSEMIPRRIQSIEIDKKAKKTTTVPTTYLQIAPYKQIVSLKKVGYPDQTVYLMENDEYLQIYKYKSYDLNLLNGAEKRALRNMYANFLRYYQDDIKNVSLMFPVNTSLQQEYWDKKYRKAKTDMQRVLASNNLRKLKAIESVYKTQSHYLFIYSSSMKDMIDKMQMISQFPMLFDGKALNRKDKEHLFERLNNQDSE